MKKTCYTEGQIAFAVKQEEIGLHLGAARIRKDISEVTFYSWKKEFADMETSD
ncbi:transposase [Yersinia enterocolitica]|uniref:transposase n=1 Tax=Yersinia TaxID=629 RepID=UPI00349F88D5